MGTNFNYFLEHSDVLKKGSRVVDELWTATKV